MMNKYLAHKVLERQFEGDFLDFRNGFLYTSDSIEKSANWESFNGVNFEDPVVYPIKVKEAESIPIRIFMISIERKIFVL